MRLVPDADSIVGDLESFPEPAPQVLLPIVRRARRVCGLGLGGRQRGLDGVDGDGLAGLGALDDRGAYRFGRALLGEQVQRARRDHRNCNLW